MAIDRCNCHISSLRSNVSETIEVSASYGVLNVGLCYASVNSEKDVRISTPVEAFARFVRDSWAWPTSVC